MIPALPSSVDAERFVLGSILLDDAMYVQAAGMAPDDFSLEKHQRIFRCMGELHACGERIDRVTVANELMKHGQLEACDGLSYLVSLDDGLPRIPNLDSYIRIVKEKATLRRIAALGECLVNSVTTDREAESGTILAEAEEQILELSERQSAARSWIGSDLTRKVMEAAARRRQQWEENRRTVTGIESGIHRLDEILNGLNTGLHLLAGGPGMGKTTLALQIARETCQRGIPAVYVTYENSPENLIQKAICARAGINPQGIERGNAHIGDHQKFQVAADELAIALPYLEIIRGSMSLTVPEIQSKVLRVLQRHSAPRCLVVVDYLQRAAQAQGFDDIRANVSSLAGHLRDLANRVDCPVLALASQNRSEGNYGDGRGSASLTSLKESGDLEYAADSVMFLRAGEQRTAVEPARAVDLTIAKNRFGPVGSVALIFRPDLDQFREAEKSEHEGGHLRAH